MATKPMSKVCRMHAADEIVNPIRHAMVDGKLNNKSK